MTRYVYDALCGDSVQLCKDDSIYAYASYQRRIMDRRYWFAQSDLGLLQLAYAQRIRNPWMRPVATDIFITDDYGTLVCVGNLKQ